MDSFRNGLTMMQPEDMVEVIGYSGYRDDESPREIIFKDQRFKVD